MNNENKTEKKPTNYKKIINHWDKKKTFEVRGSCVSMMQLAFHLFIRCFGFCVDIDGSFFFDIPSN